jgi:hypothetical protein
MESLLGIEGGSLSVGAAQQYNWLGIFSILIFGWQRSGSTTLTIVLHALNNLSVTILVAVQIEWLS